MRIPIEVEADLLTLDLPPMSSPKHNAHIQGCPRTMYKRQITNGSCCELHTTEPRKHMVSYQPLTFSHICLCIYKERDWEEEANFTASSSQSSFCIYYKGSSKLHYQEKGR